MNSLPSPQKVAGMFQGNPQALQQRVQQSQTPQQQQGQLPPDLTDLLALQMVNEQMEAAKRQMAMQQQGTPGTVMDQLRQQVVGNAKTEVQQKLGVLQQKAQDQQEGIQKLTQQAAQSSGIAGAAGTQFNLAGGGIIAFAGDDERVGSEVPPSPDDMDLAPAAGDTYAERERKRTVAAERQRAIDEYNKKLAAQRVPALEAQNQGMSDRWVGKIKDLFGIEPPPSNMDPRDIRMGAAAAPAASTGIANPPSAGAMRKRQAGNAGEIGNTTLGGTTRIADSSYTALLQAAEAGDPDAVRAAELYKQRYPDLRDIRGQGAQAPQGIRAAAPEGEEGAGAPSAGIRTGVSTTTSTPAEKPPMDDLERVRREEMMKGMQIDPRAEREKEIEYYRNMLGLDKSRAEATKELDRTKALHAEKAGQRDKVYEFLSGITNRDRRLGGNAMALGAGADAYMKAKGKWADEDIANDKVVRDAMEEIRKAELSGNMKLAEVGKQALNDYIGEKKNALNAAVTEATRMDANEARREGYQLQLQAARERIAQAKAQGGAAAAAQIRAETEQLKIGIDQANKELDSLRDAAAKDFRLSKDPSTQRRIAQLQATINEFTNEIRRMRGMPEGAATVQSPYGAPPPGAVTKRGG